MTEGIKKYESGFLLDKATYGVFNLLKKPAITDKISEVTLKNLLLVGI